MPNLELPDLQGQSRQLKDLLGDRLTVVVFWNARYVFALEQFSRLQRDVVDEFSSFGVAVVAVNVGDQVDDVRHIAAEHQGVFPCLLDKDGMAFGQVATTKLPRTYVLDAEGRVLWFDIEYSRTTERELNNAIKYSLQNLGESEGESSLGQNHKAADEDPVTVVALTSA